MKETSISSQLGSIDTCHSYAAPELVGVIRSYRAGNLPSVLSACVKSQLTHKCSCNIQVSCADEADHHIYNKCHAPNIKMHS